MKHIMNALLVALLLATTQVQAKDNLDWSNKVYGTGYIYQVVDADTLWVNVNDPNVFWQFSNLADTKDKKKALREKYRAVKMRIANINTPESVHRDSSRNSASGKAASNYLKSIAEKTKAEFVCWDHGEYGRPICSVEFNENGVKVDIGYRMISKGYSDYVTAWGKHPYAHREYLEASR